MEAQALDLLRLVVNKWEAKKWTHLEEDLSEQPRQLLITIQVSINRIKSMEIIQILSRVCNSRLRVVNSIIKDLIVLNQLWKEVSTKKIWSVKTVL